MDVSGQADCLDLDVIKELERTSSAVSRLSNSLAVPKF
jgi:hypothetical protein